MERRSFEDWTGRVMGFGEGSDVEGLFCLPYLLEFLLSSCFELSLWRMWST